ncbi:telomere repeat binding factor-domain-containing protein [Schizothecium vesticola]|uniref:Telomere repeat binding factor-domain-containing protein n=1 Tax=Schizothecium vesticola TaxID=314040 RepID=A0AA40EK00_9PEZI|nr:telomere repeat binding factor-domain-containing protein [Schizothecium vesticola]
MAETVSVEADLIAALGLPDTRASESTADETDPFHALRALVSIPKSTTNHVAPEPLSNSGPITFGGLTFPAPPPPPSQPLSQPPLPSPEKKRERSPDALEQDSGAKKQRMEHPAQVHVKSEEEHGMSGMDLEAIMQNALAGFDGIQPPMDNQTAMPPATPPAAPATRLPTRSPELDRFENRMMKASSRSTYMIRAMSLPLLGNVAVQILLRLSQQDRIETELLLADIGSEFERDYRQLINIFMPSRRVFSDSPLFFPDELEISDSDDRETVRMSNLASTAASTFGANDVSLREIHDNFLAIFVPEDGEYKGSLSNLLVDLKTQVFIDSLRECEDSQHVSALIDQFFPTEFEETLKQRSGEVMLNADEAVLVSQIKDRRGLLLNSVNDENIKSLLGNQYASFHFPEELSAFLRNHLSMVVEYADKYGVNIPISQQDPQSVSTEAQNGLNCSQWNQGDQQQHESPSFDLAALIQDATSNFESHKTEDSFDGYMADVGERDGLELRKLLEQGLSSHKSEFHQEPQGQTADATSNATIPSNLASLIAGTLAGGLEKAPDGLTHVPGPSFPMAGSNSVHESPSQFKTSTAQIPQPSYQPYAHTSAPLSHFTGPSGDQLPPNQSSPSTVLYERARQAAVAKTSTTSRREGLSTTRRPWSPEEEKALMTGLDKVKGPHWSQILSLYGPNGTVSDILKDRTQVQLKDKARNLKLFFLKTNSEMPYYLQSVTGELKTRAPTQAARKEAEEKLRLNKGGEQREFDGIMTLAGGLRDPHHPNNAAAAPRRTGPHNNTNMRPSTLSGAGAPASHRQQGTPAAPPVPIPALGKADPSDHHSMHQVNKLPQIQPAPAPPHTSAPSSNPSLAPGVAQGSGLLASVQASLKHQRQPQQSQHQQHAINPTQAPHQHQPAASLSQSYSRPQATANAINHQGYGAANAPMHHSSSDNTDAALYATLSAALHAPTASQT